MAGSEHIFKHRQVLEQADILECPRNAHVRDSVWFKPKNGLLPELDRTRGWFVDTGDQVENSGLACSVRADKADNAALRHIETHISHSSEAAKFLCKVPDTEYGRHCQSSSPLCASARSFVFASRSAFRSASTFRIPDGVSSIPPIRPFGRDTIMRMTAAP